MINDLTPAPKKVGTEAGAKEETLMAIYDHLNSEETPGCRG